MSGKYRVLIFDNNLSCYDRLRKMSVWHEKGFEIVGKTSNITDALNICKNSQAELVICFNRSSLPSTEAVISAVSEVSPSTVCIAAGNAGDSETMRRCFIIGAIDYVSEPVSELRLCEALDIAEVRLTQSLSGSDYSQTVEEFISELDISDKRFLERLTAFLNESKDVIATTESAADWFGFNKDYFGRLFKSKVGMTFGIFYKSFRIRYASRLLSSGRYRVYEVSEMLGFSSVDYFSNVFKKLTGKTPSQVKSL
ncbi:response regulator transcription factor [Ruminococcus sp. NK3A76]|uniref:AraC family transcriptional regulator n=1 Tax=Ruminococcus sp. NK3A76 TaxID=877411 RepID=UPI0004900CFF|nr:response regulator transcription factor [Ruminococcus sp. NK3A76]